MPLGLPLRSEFANPLSGEPERVGNSTSRGWALLPVITKETVQLTRRTTCPIKCQALPEQQLQSGCSAPTRMTTEKVC